MRYAQINPATGRCAGVSDLSGQVDAPNMVAIADADYPIGQVWNGGAFEETPVEPEQTLLTASGFYDLFTLTEQERWFWYLERGSLPTGSTATTDDQKKLILASKRLEAVLSRGVDMSHPLITQTVAVMAAAGFLDDPVADRQAAILAGTLP